MNLTFLLVLLLILRLVGNSANAEVWPEMVLYRVANSNSVDNIERELRSPHLQLLLSLRQNGEDPVAISVRFDKETHIIEATCARDYSFDGENEVAEAVMTYMRQRCIGTSRALLFRIQEARRSGKESPANDGLTKILHDKTGIPASIIKNVEVKSGISDSVRKLFASCRYIRDGELVRLFQIEESGYVAMYTLDGRVFSDLVVTDLFLKEINKAQRKSQATNWAALFVGMKSIDKAMREKCYHWRGSSNDVSFGGHEIIR